MPALLGALAEEHRLNAAGIGQAAMLELLSIGMSTALAGIALRPVRLRLLGALSCLALAALAFATLRVSGAAILGVRALAGVPEGILLWIGIGMIARTALPARWSAIFLVATALSQLSAVTLLAAVVLPRAGADGGFEMLAACMLLGLAAAMFAPHRYASLAESGHAEGAPPPLGWIALAATFVFMAALGAVGIYLQPLAAASGLSAGVARAAMAVGLAAQIAGAGVAALLATRWHHLRVFLICTAGFLCVWTVYHMQAPGWAFVVATGAAGFFYMFVVPFLVPLAIEADPSRRAAILSGGVQLLGSAMGPFLASLLVGQHGVRSALDLAAGLIVLAFAIIAVLHRLAMRLPAEPPVAQVASP